MIYTSVTNDLLVNVFNTGGSKTKNNNLRCDIKDSNIASKDDLSFITNILWA